MICRRYAEEPDLDRMQRPADPPPVIPVTRAQVLGVELMQLTRDDGARLAEIIADLRQGLAAEPNNLIAVNALVHALAFAGQREEAQRLAWEAWLLMQRLPVVGTDTLLNVGAGLSETGRLAEAKRCYEMSFAREGISGLPGLHENMLNLAVRYGEFDWLEQFATNHPVADYLRHHDLANLWRAQQAAIEDALASRVSTFSSKLESFDDGTSRLVIDYFTDCDNPGAIERLQEAVWAAVEHVRPTGLAALLGVVILNVNGPETPLP